jgi:hypothetical protein
MSSSSYEITDGDIPCTEEQEKDYHYAFNVCNPIESLHDSSAWDYCKVQLHSFVSPPLMLN